MNCSSFRNSSTKLSEGHNWPGRSLHRRWRICGALSKGPNLGVSNMQICEVRNFIPCLRRSAFREFVDRWPLGRATATFHGRVIHHCYEWRSSQFPCKMQDIARSLPWSVCVIETDRRWRCLADWNGWTFFRNPIAREGQSHSTSHRSTQDWSLCCKSYLPSTSWEFEVDIIRLAALAPFSLFAFPSSSEPWQSRMLG